MTLNELNMLAKNGFITNIALYEKLKNNPELLAKTKACDVTTQIVLPKFEEVEEPVEEIAPVEPVVEPEKEEEIAPVETVVEEIAPVEPEKEEEIEDSPIVVEEIEEKELSKK